MYQDAAPAPTDTTSTLICKRMISKDSIFVLFFQRIYSNFLENLCFIYVEGSQI